MKVRARERAAVRGTLDPDFGERMIQIYSDSLKSREKFLAFRGSEDSDGA
jgi:hypothetical protein